MANLQGQKIGRLQRTGQSELKNAVYSLAIFTEQKPLVLQNDDIFEFWFVEDIFKYSMVGKLVFNDRYNMLELSPFTGNENIVLFYSVGDSRRELVFDIWKVGRIQGMGTGARETDENIIELHLVDPFFAGFSVKKYSRSWNNELYSDIMKDILNNMVFFKNGGRKFNIEESINRGDFVMPSWTPGVSMKWLLRRAKGYSSDSSGYLCFNNTRNTFSHNLVSMNYLLSDLGRTYDNNRYTITKQDDTDPNKILEWWINSLDKTSLPKIRGCDYHGFDFKTKQFLNVHFKYSDGVEDTVMLGKKTLFADISSIDSNEAVGDSDNLLIENIAYNDWSKRYNMQLIVNFIVEGNENRFAGQLIEVDWPSVFRDDAGTSHQFHEMLKGKYLIKSVTHMFNSGKSFPYTQRLVCIKNSYHGAARTEKTLLQSTKVNLTNEIYKSILRK